MKIALVHEFLTQYGGAERVLDAFLEIWPKAPIYTLVYDEGKMGQFYGRSDIRPSFIQNLWAPPPAGYKWWLPLFPKAIESFDLSGFNVVLSDSSAFAKGVLTQSPAVHISYLHTPTRYLWSDQKDYLRDAPIPGAIRPFLPPFLHYLRRWDLKAAGRPDYLIANSRTVADRMRRYYCREPNATIFPPVDTQRFTPAKTVGDYWLVVGRQEPYKRTDVAIAAATKLGLKLKVVGIGTRATELRSLAGPTIEFLGRVTDEELAKLYAGAIGLIFPPLEDAGITPLEAMAAGRPVLAFGEGGTRETVIPGKTGEFFAEQTIESLVAALSKFQPERYDPKEIRQHVEQYDIKKFQEKIVNFVRKFTKTDVLKGVYGTL